MQVVHVPMLQIRGFRFATKSQSCLHMMQMMHGQSLQKLTNKTAVAFICTIILHCKARICRNSERDLHNSERDLHQDLYGFATILIPV